jgi:signal transduction histidine kinase
MTLGYLYISEKNLKSNREYAYQSDIYSVASNLEQQNTISNTWLSQLEASKNCYVAIFDNGNEFLFNRVSPNELRNQVIENAWTYYAQNKDNLDRNEISYKSSYISYSISNNNDNYDCFVITITQNSTPLELLMVSPLEAIQNQLLKQRIIFFIIIMFAIIAIWILAWVFTGKVLYPIEENRKRQNQFVAAASHELRTPLAVILSTTEAIEIKLKTQLEKYETANNEILNYHTSNNNTILNNNCNTTALNIQQDIKTIHDETIRVSHLLGDMLTLSSSDAGHFTLNTTPTELDTLILNVYENFENMAKQKNITFNVNLPNTTIPLFNCDKERIIQLITILVHNAISYTPENGKIDISLAYEKKHFTISVADNGIGITDDEKNKIFDRFYRSDKSRTSKEHFGLGLSIATQIVTAHNGHISVSDTPNGGATFTVCFKNL